MSPLYTAITDMQPTYIDVTIGLIIRNCNASCQCDNNELNGDLGKLHCIATSVMQVEIIWHKQNLRVRYFRGQQKYNVMNKLYN